MSGKFLKKKSSKDSSNAPFRFSAFVKHSIDKSNAKAKPSEKADGIQKLKLVKKLEEPEKVLKKSPSNKPKNAVVMAPASQESLKENPERPDFSSDVTHCTAEDQTQMDCDETHTSSAALTHNEDTTLNWKSISHEEKSNVAFVGVHSSCNGLTLKGKFGIRSLKGSCFINGRLITDEDANFLPVHSPNTHRGFEIMPTQSDSKGDCLNENGPYFKYLDALSAYETVLQIKGACEQSSFVQYPGYLGIYTPLSKKDTRICEGCWQTKTTWVHRMDYGYSGAAQEICQSERDDLVVLCCGGKDVGKSSFNRFTMSLMLQNKRYPFVYYLELDVGQAEFTPSGFVSLHRVEMSDSLLSPPFEHLKKPIFSSYFGDFSAAGEPTVYLQTVEYVWNYLKRICQDETAPVFVNTMGWKEDLGSKLLVDTIRLVKPTHLVQFIASNLENRNFATDFTSAIHCGCAGWLTRADEHLIDYKYLPVKVQITTDEKRQNYTSADNRNLAFYSYFSTERLQKVREAMEDESVESLLPGEDFLNNFLSMPVYSIKVDKVNVFCVDNDSTTFKHVFSVLNAATVGLSTIGEEGDAKKRQKFADDDVIPKPPVCRSHGLGVVRAVDPESRDVYVITPLGADEMRRVDCLIVGRWNLPSHLLVDQQRKFRGSGALPYVSNAFPSQAIGAESLRSSKSFGRVFK